jgi:hypothetical protein
VPWLARYFRLKYGCHIHDKAYYLKALETIYCDFSQFLADPAKGIDDGSSGGNVMGGVLIYNRVSTRPSSAAAIRSTSDIAMKEVRRPY